MTTTGNTSADVRGLISIVRLLPGGRDDPNLRPEQVVPLEPKAVERMWKPARELVLELASAGPALPTNLPTLDEWTRGGLRQGKLVAIGGAPGAGKTTLALQLAHVYHDAGHPVLVYAADESCEGLITRWGQQCGLVREDIEAAHEPTREALAQHFDLALVDFVDPDEATLNHAVAWLVQRAADVGVAGVLVVDSLQTCRIDGGDLLETRQRIDMVVRTVKAAAASGLIVLTTSEVSRGFYRSSSDRIDPLAAFKESGAIEYALTLGIVLASVKGETGQADAFIVKNRMGRHSTSDVAFRLRLDFDRAMFSEIERPDASPEAEDLDAIEAAAVERLANEMERALVTARGDVKSRPDLYALVKGKGQRKVKAASLLITTGRIEGGSGHPFRIVRQSFGGSE